MQTVLFQTVFLQRTGHAISDTDSDADADVTYVGAYHRPSDGHFY